MSDDRPYSRIAAYVSSTAWAIHPPILGVMGAVLAERRSGNRPAATEIRRRLAIGRELRGEGESLASVPPNVKVLRLDGMIVPKAAQVADISGPASTSIEGLRSELRAALADRAISAIVIDVDSPGGSAELVPELGAEILGARGQKPIVAVANTWAASAAYWLASAADELVVTPSGQVGSIGVYSVHEDLSEAMKQKGIDVSMISAGDYKVEGNPFEPLSAEARAEMQSKVDAYYGMFLEAVASQRGVSREKVEADFGQGRMVLAEEAVSRGMADRVATLDATVERLAASPAPATLSAAAAGMSFRERATFYRGLKREERRPSELRERLRPQIRSTSDGPVVEGYACVYEVEYSVWDHLGEYTESVAAGAATKTLREDPDVRYMVNHEGVPLARTKPGTLTLSQRDDGIFYETSPLDMRNPKAQEIVSAIDRGDVDGSSFAFRTVRDKWNPTYTERRILEIALQDGDVSSVTFPANPHTSAGLRARELVQQLATRELDELLVEARSREELAGAIATAAGRLQEILEELAGDRARTARDTRSTLTLEKARRDLELLELGIR